MGSTFPSHHNIYTLKVTLTGTPITRTIEVADCTRAELLYELITFLFSWNQNHDHEFIYYDDDELMEFFDEFSLRQTDFKEGDTFYMHYDMACDCWNHTIEILSIKPMETDYEDYTPRCLEVCYGDPGERSGGNAVVNQLWNSKFAQLPSPSLAVINDTLQFFWLHLLQEAKEDDEETQDFEVEEKLFDELFSDFRPFFQENITTPSLPKPCKPKIKGRKVPNYAYKPRGKRPFQYFNKKITEILKWQVNDVNDLNYAIRVFEGWTAQAQKYNDAAEYAYANFISSLVFWNGSYFYQRHYLRYEKQQSRMKKFISHAHDLVQLTLPHDEANWREMQLIDYQRLQKENLEINRAKGGVNLKEAIKKVEGMMEKSEK